MNSRWRFCGYGGADDLAARAASTAKIDAWWRAFQAKASDLDALFSRQSEWDLPEWMATHLQAIDPGLMWEYGPAVHGEGHRLVITPETSRHLRPMTATILERAPHIDGWEFYAYRLAEDLESTQLTVEARTGGTLADVHVRVGRGESHLVDMCFTSPRTTSDDDEVALHEAFVAAETLLGEECLDRWIGAIEVSPAPKGGLKSLLRSRSAEPMRGIPLDRLKATVDAVVGSIRDQLPSQPHCDWIDGAEWTLWNLTPQEADDYAHQHDLLIGRSANAAMWTAAHGPGMFCSERFSRQGETFCFVKIDGAQGLEGTEFADKTEIEDALDEVLRPNRLGCQIGGGTGLRYSYIDLALVDLERGIDSVRKRLEQGRVPIRTWIQFFDADLAAEWVGVYSETPSPPMNLDDE